MALVTLSKQVELEVPLNDKEIAPFEVSLPFKTKEQSSESLRELNKSSDSTLLTFVISVSDCT